jgi:hypothetical protein
MDDETERDRATSHMAFIASLWTMNCGRLFLRWWEKGGLVKECWCWC